VPTGLAGFQNFFRDDFAKLPPEVKAALRMEILHLVAEGDLVTIHVRFSGTGRDGKPFERTEFDLFRIERDRIAEHWDATP
jgi:predicted SnoaL-like aldol condensation-catalyzing enzyme